jgi:putative oxidoreductase
MAVAHFLEHFPHGCNPVFNGGMPAVLDSFVFLYFAAVGEGRFALDRT